ncbi:MAG: amino acid ABC transporter substrate-binding protein [Candidatus Eisenbacteria bacterium]|uniref:Amino acid ABC transporter substrate-binding protein n=1 Tax=Eiseniibacteriota bacterium TaxID=2212470 RepID=A0A538U384_UNCEI|nr:MAG: amino acid ABC transporter substrate-binding protein [Candidatus Eisenbacteria bacterium]
MSRSGPAGPQAPRSEPPLAPPAAAVRRAVAIAAALALPALLAGPGQAGRAPAVPDLRAADSLAMTAPDRARDQALAGWAAHAPLPELLYLLRRPPESLAASEAPLVAAALRLAPATRVALRRRLLLRMAAAAPAQADRAWRELAPAAAQLPVRPRASAFRIAAILPDTGDYQAFGKAVRLGLETGLAQHNAAARFPLELALETSGDDSPARVAAAFDRAAAGAGVIVGGLMSGPTTTLATAARLTGLPIVSPTATDESIGAIGPMVFQIGPSGLQRGRALARAALAGGPRRVGVLVSDTGDRGPFARGFAAAAESLGASVVWTASYPAGDPDFHPELKAIKAKAVELLFWDGEAGDAATLLRQLAQERMSLAICGGAELEPERHHPQARMLLEGVMIVGEDWVLSPGSQAVVDSAARAAGEEHANRLHTRGYLTARLIASAVEGGAWCPEEVGAALTTRVGADPYLASHGFLDWTPPEATLPVYEVKLGRAVLR